MRPVLRGPAPTDDAGDPVAHTSYGAYRGALIDAMGEYCSFCERWISAGLAVEHVQPKVHHPALELEWSNFLLGCTNCNSTKGAADVPLADCLWPHRDNTFRALRYQVAKVSVDTSLSAQQQTRAKRLIELVGLDKGPTTAAGRSDRRWQHRHETWNHALTKLADLRANKTTPKRIAEFARQRGHFSIWMTVFATRKDVRRALLRAFPGTDPTSFDDDGLPVARPGGLA